MSEEASSPPEAVVHRLRSRQSDFQRFLNGTRTFEIRARDRDYQAGDILEMVEFVPCAICGGKKKTADEKPKACECCYTVNPGGHYSGRAVQVTVSHVVDLPRSKGDRPLVVLGVSRPASRFSPAQVHAWAQRFGLSCEKVEDIVRLQEAMQDGKDRIPSLIAVMTGVLPVTMADQRPIKLVPSGPPSHNQDP